MGAPGAGAPPHFSYTYIHVPLLATLILALCLASSTTPDLWPVSAPTSQNIFLPLCYPHTITLWNQAHTCKTLGVVTIPKSLLARMRRSRVVELISYTRPRPSPLGAGRGREHESMSSRACHAKHHAS